MRKTKIIILFTVFVFSLLSFAQQASAQEINYCSEPGSTTVFNQILLERLSPADGGWYGVAGNINDENDATYIGGMACNFGIQPRVQFEGIVNFPVSISTIDRIEWIGFFHCIVCQPPNAGYSNSAKTSLFYNGVWNQVDDISLNYNAVPKSILINGPWFNVTAVKVNMYIKGSCWAGIGPRAHLYELRAFGSPAVVVPTVVTNNATNILETSSILNGNITDIGGENAAERGFDWGTVSGVYPNEWTEVGSYGIGAFNRGIAGLAPSTTYYFRAKARNSAGWGYGAEMSFATNAPLIPPCQNHELWGYAWSENIGWISFSCPVLGAGVDYGVDIDEANDLLEGYAWSKNIGWIDFNATGIDVSGGTGALSGWARACSVFQVGCSGALRPLSETGGWDGLISLDGASYQVTLNSTPTPSEFEDYAWGSDVVGWISFNGDNELGGADYAVLTNFSPNSAPTATNLNSPNGNYCPITYPPINFNWTFSDPDPGDTQISYQIEVDNNNDFSSPEILDAGGVSETYTSGLGDLSFSTTYYWRVDVSDGIDSSGWINGPSFATDPRWPEPSFTWAQDPASFDVVFDGSVNYCASCSYSWDFGDGAGTSSLEDPTYSYLAENNYNVIFTATSAGRSCNYSETINVGVALPLPVWEETVPF